MIHVLDLFELILFPISADIYLTNYKGYNSIPSLIEALSIQLFDFI